MKIEKHYIESAGGPIYIELGYPTGKNKIRDAVVVAHGLRSYYTGFLDTFAKKIRDAGYISVKFHFLGTGKSSGLFEDKTTKAMVQNYKDVINFLKNHPNIKNIGVVGRSNAGNLAIIAGPDPRIKSYIFLASMSFFSTTLQASVDGAKVVGKYFYNPSFKRRHTKGEGRLPIAFVDEAKKYDKIILHNIPLMRNSAYFQSTKDEVVLVSKGHYDYFKTHLPNPHKMYLIEGGNHSYKGNKKFVISESIKWLKATL